MLNDDINQLAQNKLVILYILLNSPYNFDNDKLTNFLLEKEIMNYFLIKQYLSELVEAELVSSDDNGNLFLTEIGKTSLDLFVNKISTEQIEKIKSWILQYNKNIKIEKEILGNVLEDDYGNVRVLLKIIENHQEIFKLELAASTRQEAENMVKNWKSSTNTIYMTILKALYEEE